MACKEFIVLYTHQKQKKAKVWQDGILKWSADCEKKATLFDDQRNRLEKIHIKDGQINVGDDLESARHLITVEELKTTTANSKDQPAAENPSSKPVLSTRPVLQQTSRNPLASGTGGSGLPRTGLLRKRTAPLYNEDGNRLDKKVVKSGRGFIPPRLLKKPRLDDEEDSSPSEPTPVLKTPSAQPSHEHPDPTKIFSLYSQVKPTGNSKSTCIKETSALKESMVLAPPEEKNDCMQKPMAASPWSVVGPSTKSLSLEVAAGRTFNGAERDLSIASRNACPVGEMSKNLENGQCYEQRRQNINFEKCSDKLSMKGKSDNSNSEALSRTSRVVCQQTEGNEMKQVAKSLRVGAGIDTTCSKQIPSKCNRRDPSLSTAMASSVPQRSDTFAQGQNLCRGQEVGIVRTISGPLRSNMSMQKPAPSSLAGNRQNVHATCNKVEKEQTTVKRNRSQILALIQSKPKQVAKEIDQVKDVDIQPGCAKRQGNGNPALEPELLEKGHEMQNVSSKSKGARHADEMKCSGVPSPLVKHSIGVESRNTSVPLAGSSVRIDAVSCRLKGVPEPCFGLEKRVSLCPTSRVQLANDSGASSKIPLSKEVVQNPVASEHFANKNSEFHHSKEERNNGHVPRISHPQVSAVNLGSESSALSPQITPGVPVVISLDLPSKPASSVLPPMSETLIKNVKFPSSSKNLSEARHLNCTSIPESGVEKCTCTTSPSDVVAMQNGKNRRTCDRCKSDLSGKETCDLCSELTSSELLAMEKLLPAEDAAFRDERPCAEVVNPRQLVPSERHKGPVQLTTDTSSCPPEECAQGKVAQVEERDFSNQNGRKESESPSGRKNMANILHEKHLDLTDLKENNSLISLPSEFKTRTEMSNFGEEGSCYSVLENLGETLVVEEETKLSGSVSSSADQSWKSVSGTVNVGVGCGSMQQAQICEDTWVEDGHGDTCGVVEGSHELLSCAERTDGTSETRTSSCSNVQSLSPTKWQRDVSCARPSSEGENPCNESDCLANSFGAQQEVLVRNTNKNESDCSANSFGAQQEVLVRNANKNENSEAKDFENEEVKSVAKGDDAVVPHESVSEMDLDGGIPDSLLAGVADMMDVEKVQLNGVALNEEKNEKQLDSRRLIRYRHRYSGEDAMEDSGEMPLKFGVEVTQGNGLSTSKGNCGKVPQNVVYADECSYQSWEEMDCSEPPQEDKRPGQQSGFVHLPERACMAGEFQQSQNQVPPEEEAPKSSLESRSEGWTQDTFATGCTFENSQSSAKEEVQNDTTSASPCEDVSNTQIPTLGRRELAYRRPFDTLESGTKSGGLRNLLDFQGQQRSGQVQNVLGNGGRPVQTLLANSSCKIGDERTEYSESRDLNSTTAMEKGDPLRRFGIMELCESQGIFKPLSSQRAPPSHDVYEENGNGTSCLQALRSRTELPDRLRRTEAPGIDMAALVQQDDLNGESRVFAPDQFSQLPSLVHPSELKMGRMNHRNPPKPEEESLDSSKVQDKQSLEAYKPRGAKSSAVVRRTQGTTDLPLAQVDQSVACVDQHDESEPSLYFLDMSSKEAFNLSEKMNYFMEKSCDFNFSPLAEFDSPQASPYQEVPVKVPQVSESESSKEESPVYRVPAEDAVHHTDNNSSKLRTFTVPDVPVKKERKPLKSKPLQDDMCYDSYTQSQTIQESQGSNTQERRFTQNVIRQNSPQICGVPQGNCESPELFTQECPAPQNFDVKSQRFGNECKYTDQGVENEDMEEAHLIQHSENDLDMSVSSVDLNVSGYHMTQNFTESKDCGSFTQKPVLRTRNDLHVSGASLPKGSMNFRYEDKLNCDNRNYEFAEREVPAPLLHLRNSSSDFSNLRKNSFVSGSISANSDVVGNRNSQILQKRASENSKNVTSKWNRYQDTSDNDSGTRTRHYHGRFSPPKSCSTQLDPGSVCDRNGDFASKQTGFGKFNKPYKNPGGIDQKTYPGSRDCGSFGNQVPNSRFVPPRRQSPDLASQRVDWGRPPIENQAGSASSSREFGSVSPRTAQVDFVSPNHCGAVASEDADFGKCSPDPSCMSPATPGEQEHWWVEKFRQEKETGKTSTSTGFQTPVIGGANTRGEGSLGRELCFPSQQEVSSKPTPVRQATVQTTFPNAHVYKQAVISVLTEHLNVILFTLAKTYHQAFEKADVSCYLPSVGGTDKTSSLGKLKGTRQNNNPPCEHGQPSKIVQVRKEGKNKGRFFFGCDAPRNQQCKFFKWADEVKSGTNSPSTQQNQTSKIKLSDPQSICTFFKGQSVPFYCECQFLRKAPERHRQTKVYSAWLKRKIMEEERNAKKKIYLKLSRKESASSYSKDDLWVVSLDFNFEPGSTFIARSSFYGPNSSNEVEIDPIAGFSPSRWNNNDVCHAIHAGNAASEFTCISTIQDHVEPKMPPIISHLIDFNYKSISVADGGTRFSAPKVVKSPETKTCYIPKFLLEEETDNFIRKYQLNPDQASALQGIAAMFDTESEDVPAIQLIHDGDATTVSKISKILKGKKEDNGKDDKMSEVTVASILTTHLLKKLAPEDCDWCIDQTYSAKRKTCFCGCKSPLAFKDTSIGVFGAGKSYLLAVLVMFLVEVFHHSDVHTPDIPFPWKILISSTTNVAVDRILNSLLDMGFEDFVRVGSVKKIAKPVLPYSVHASGTDSQELKDLQDMLRSELTPSEKHCVRKSIEQHRLGLNKKKLSSTRVVGATCAACPFKCMDKMAFPVVFLDECSQITEPSSLLPIARFKCEKLVLIGDPKQLGPTIQGSEAAHGNGLEQTLFDRLLKMGYKSTLLRTQYRCHPRISKISNSLFYHGQLIDGIGPEQRPPLIDDIPPSCFYNVSTGLEQCSPDGSFYNETEVEFVVSLIEMLLISDVEPASIGVITLYRSQMFRLVAALQACSFSDHSGVKAIQISTVDAFQGGEKEVIILSCVRTQAVGFMDSEQRTNVALTRAKNHLLIVGHMKNLSTNALWGKIISHCRGYPSGVQHFQDAKARFKLLIEQRKSENRPASGEAKKSKRKTSRKQTSPQVRLDEDCLTGEENEANSCMTPHITSEALGTNISPGDDALESPPMSLDSTSCDTSPVNPPPKRRRHTIDASIFDEDPTHNENESDNEDLPEFLA